MSEMVVLGDEAVAMGAIDAGLSVAYGYPGTPSTEIMEFLQKYEDKEGGIRAMWCANEKTSFEGAVGVSYVGRRALVTMKHVGLNVAADPFVNSSLVKINGGLVAVVADDPGMHSSQNEQDSRFFADYAGVICLEPRNHQEAYDITREAFDLSEKYNSPVMIRLATRISHSRGAIHTTEKREQNAVQKADNRFDWILLPGVSRKRWDIVLKKQKDFLEYSENAVYNKLELNPDFGDYGVISAGLGTNYFKEIAPDLPVKPSHLHIAVYPVPASKVKELAKKVDKIVIFEEGYPFIEKQLRSILNESENIQGKMDGFLPASGELDPDIVRKVLGLEPKPGVGVEVGDLPARPPQLCVGCPHIDTFNAINEAIKDCDQSFVSSDIGCYSLGALPPYSATESILCMGASIGTAKGAVEAGFSNVIATIGDSTFTHSGITPLLDAVSANVNMTLIIMDNSTTAMTGGQDTVLSSPQRESLIKGAGVPSEHIRVIVPLKKNAEENIKVIKEEMAHDGVSVIIALRECIQTLKKTKSKQK